MGLEEKGTLQQMFCYRAGDEIASLDLRPGWKAEYLLFAYLLTWMEWPKGPRECLLEFGVWDKAMSQAKKVWRGRPIGSIWDGMGRAASAMAVTSTAKQELKLGD